MRLFPVKKLRPRSRFESYSSSVEYATHQRLAASAGRIGLAFLTVSTGLTAIHNVMDKVPATVVKPTDVVLFAAEVALTQFCHRWYQDAVGRSEETFGEYTVIRRAELTGQQRQRQLQKPEVGVDQAQTVQAQPESGEPSAPQPSEQSVSNGQVPPSQPPSEPPTPPASP